MQVIQEFMPATDTSHLDQLLPAFLEIWNSPENLKYLSFSQCPFEVEIVRGWFEQHLSARVRYFGILGEQDNVIGISVVRADPIAIFELFALAVHPNYQGRGIGRKLILHSLEVAHSHKFTCAEVSVFVDNTRMLRLLLSLGFIPVRIDHHRRADGADLLVLQKKISRMV
jgi:ribosomal protein S18 acetylase RimI-like enzyme